MSLKSYLIALPILINHWSFSPSQKWDAPATAGSGVYISGYPMSLETEGVRNYEFTNGQISSRPEQKQGGYTTRYTAVRGMSGSPVFDVSGRVVGIHGQGDQEGSVKNESASGFTGIEIKRGLNAAIPINSFTAIMPSLKISNSPYAERRSPLIPQPLLPRG